MYIIPRNVVTWWAPCLCRWLRALDGQTCRTRRP